MNESGDFYEDDQPIEDVLRAFEDGERGITAAPVRSFLFTIVVPQVVTASYQVGEWVSVEAHNPTDSLTNVR